MTSHFWGGDRLRGMQGLPVVLVQMLTVCRKHDPQFLGCLQPETVPYRDSMNLSFPVSLFRSDNKSISSFYRIVTALSFWVAGVSPPECTVHLTPAFVYVCLLSLCSSSSLSEQSHSHVCWATSVGDNAKNNMCAVA